MVTESGHLRVRDESLVALGKKGTPKAPHSRAAFIERVGNKLRLRMEGRGRPTYHDLGLDCTLVSTSPYPTYYPHITAFREELSRWGFYYFNPETMRAETPLKRAETLGPFGADLAAFYNTLRSANRPQFEAINRALRSLVPSVEKLDVERTPDGLLRLQVIENGVPFSASLISEGTLRVLGLLAITNPLGPTTVVGYEEPENGVHPRRLQLIAELLKNAAQSGKQILINTHSPKLPEYVEPASVVVCSRDERQTAFRPLANYGPLFRPEQIDAALQETPIEERVLRGDFGG
jgi:predicted ATPase